MSTRTAPSPWLVRCREHTLDCRKGNVHVMGVLNVTPDSFSDGGAYVSPDDALRRAREMVKQGATVIDIGGESTRPGSTPVDEWEELKRVAPVIERITSELPDVIVSIDTYKARVAREALAAGAHMVNDVTGLRLGTDIAKSAAEVGAAIVVMHSVGEPGTLTQPSSYDDVVEDVTGTLRESVDNARSVGVRSVIVDAGFGFGKSHDDNLRLVAETSTIRNALDCPVLVGVSRKSTIGAVLGSPENPLPADRRLYGSLGLAALAAFRNASILRVHDIRATVELVGIMKAAEKAQSQTTDQ